MVIAMTDCFDFDGLGHPVPAHRHLNPDGTSGGWIADSAQVAHTVYVAPSAQVFGHAIVGGRARLKDNAKVYGYAEVKGSAKLSEQAQVGGHAQVMGWAKILGNAQVKDHAKVWEQAVISGNAVLRGVAMAFGDVWISSGEHTDTIFSWSHAKRISSQALKTVAALDTSIGT